MRRFVVVGQAIPKGNKRPIRRKDGKLGVREINPHAAEFGNLIRIMASRNAVETGKAVLGGPTGVQAHFRVPRPKKVPEERKGWPAAKPDADKLVRTVLDGLSKVQYDDDNGICWLLVTKQYVEGTGPPTTTIQVDPLRRHGEAEIPCMNCQQLRLLMEPEC